MNWSSWSCCELWSETENEQVHGNFYHGSLLVWKQMTSKIQQKVYGRLVLRKCEINSDTAGVQCINHLCAFEPWEKNEESAVGPNVEPKTPIAGVADWPDCILGFCRSLPQNMPAHVDARKQACGKFTAVANAADLYKDTCAVFRGQMQMFITQPFIRTNLSNYHLYSLKASTARDGFAWNLLYAFNKRSAYRLSS